MAEQHAISISGKFVLFIVFLAIAVVLIVSPEARQATWDLVDYVINKIKCLFSGSCFTEDDKTAIDSTKALACAIDTTAYWSVKDTDLVNCLNDIEEGKKNGEINSCLFDKIDSCTEGELGYETAQQAP